MTLVPHRFLASKKLYAIDPASFRVVEVRNGEPDEEYLSWRYEVDAVWFRRRADGNLAAFFGYLYDMNTSVDNSDTNHEWSLEEFIAYVNKSFYGALHVGYWDGDVARWDRTTTTELQNDKLPLLMSMLENYSDVPADFTGWYFMTETLLPLRP